jgi:hypothetical protein
MKMKMFPLALGLVILGVGAASGFAQDTTSKTKSKADIRKITGCLSKGERADEFMLAGKDGSTWEVRSSLVPLADHVGHTITATGVVSHAKLHNLKEDAKDAASDSGIKKTNSEYGHLKITAVNMLSDSCHN